MKFQPLPVYGGSYADDTKSWSAQDVLGWLPSNAEVPGTKTEGMFKTPPGLRPFAEITPGGGSRPVRGAWNAEGKMFVVIGTTLYQLSNAGVFIPIGTIPGTGRVIFSHNQVSLGNQVLAVNGSAGYIYDTRDQTFQRITDPGYPGAFVATFIDGYFVQISANRRFAFNSDVANGLEYNTLDRFTSEFSPDLLVSLVASNNELFLLSETSGEFFENTGASQQPFRSKRITMDRGCAGAYTVAKADNTVFWLGNNGYFYVLNGYAPQRISTRAIEQSILGKNWKQCFAFAWEDAGHTVIYWTFPDGLTWGYDTSTGLWHRRESYGLSRWRVNTMTFWNQEWYAGDFQYGRVWKMDWDYILEGDQEFPSERTTAIIHDNQNRIIIPRLELLMQVGQEETVPAEFPEQPEAPELDPVLVDGALGLVWPGGTYAATGGTPPYTYSSRPGTVWPGDLGPMSMLGVVPAETPGSIGEGVNVVRVTDSNGLFTQINDTFNISAAMVVGGAETSPSQPSAAYSSDGQAWTGVANAQMPGNSPAVGFGNGRWVCVINGSAWYSSNLATWTPSTTVPTSGSVPVSVGFGENTFIAVGSSGLIYRSIDDCVNFSAITDVGSNYLCVSYGDGRWIAGVEGSATGPYRTSVDNGLTWTQGSLVFPYLVGAALYNGERWAIGGGTSNPADDGGIKTSTDGVSWSGGIVTPGRVWTITYGNGIWVALCQGGIIIYSDDDWQTFSTSATTVNDVSRSTQICFSGQVFVICDNNGPLDAFTRTSVDGNTWTSPVSTFLADNLIVVSGYQYGEP